MKTAVEWLVEQICTDVEMYDEYGNVERIEFWNAFKSCTDLSEYINQAKEMEKEQIVKAAQDNFYVGQDLANGCKVDWNSAEQYYNQTYKRSDDLS